MNLSLNRTISNLTSRLYSNWSKLALAGGVAAFALNAFAGPANAELFADGKDTYDKSAKTEEVAPADSLGAGPEPPTIEDLLLNDFIEKYGIQNPSRDHLHIYNVGDIDEVNDFFSWHQYTQDEIDQVMAQATDDTRYCVFGEDKDRNIKFMALYSDGGKYMRNVHLPKFGAGELREGRVLVDSEGKIPTITIGEPYVKTLASQMNLTPGEGEYVAIGGLADVLKQILTDGDSTGVLTSQLEPGQQRGYAGIKTPDKWLASDPLLYNVIEAAIDNLEHDARVLEDQVKSIPYDNLAWLMFQELGVTVEQPFDSECAVEKEFADYFKLLQDCRRDLWDAKGHKKIDDKTIAEITETLGFANEHKAAIRQAYTEITERLGDWSAVSEANYQEGNHFGLLSVLIPHLYEGVGVHKLHLTGKGVANSHGRARVAYKHVDFSEGTEGWDWRLRELIAIEVEGGSLNSEGRKVSNFAATRGNKSNYQQIIEDANMTGSIGIAQAYLNLLGPVTVFGQYGRIENATEGKQVDLIDMLYRNGTLISKTEQRDHTNPSAEEIISGGGISLTPIEGTPTVDAFYLFRAYTESEDGVRTATKTSNDIVELHDMTSGGEEERHHAGIGTEVKNGHILVGLDASYAWGDGSGWRQYFSRAGHEESLENFLSTYSSWLSAGVIAVQSPLDGRVSFSYNWKGKDIDFDTKIMDWTENRDTRDWNLVAGLYVQADNVMQAASQAHENNRLRLRESQDIASANHGLLYTPPVIGTGVEGGYREWSSAEVSPLFRMDDHEIERFAKGLVRATERLAFEVGYLTKDTQHTSRLPGMTSMQDGQERVEYLQLGVITDLKLGTLPVNLRVTYSDARNDKAHDQINVQVGAGHIGIGGF
ncbi:MAG: hypothetical protein KJ709_06005 [Nanoarchaeota archaeon]|nr:hypothetical protein [Nanoarchaeota archaeon]